MSELLILRTRTIEGAQAGPHLLITGGVHGDEFEPMVAVRRLMNQIRPEALRGKLTLVPVVNEPAFRRGARSADDNLDLARTCPGQANGTITQRIAHALTMLISCADYYIDLHTGGTRLSVLPLAGYLLHKNPAVLAAQRKMARAFNLPIIWGTDSSLDGRSLSVARDANVPAIYAEYLGGGQCDPRGIEAYVDGSLNVMAALGMLDQPPPPSAVKHVVEDATPQSGHLQRSHPSPCEGYFEACVGLGDYVTAGQCIGWIVTPLGEHREPVHADQTGLVLTLRTFPAVQSGDGLAVILNVGLQKEGFHD